jgi:hypothetical protein
MLHVSFSRAEAPETWDTVLYADSGHPEHDIRSLELGGQLIYLRNVSEW